MDMSRMLSAACLYEQRVRNNLKICQETAMQKKVHLYNTEFYLTIKKCHATQYALTQQGL